MLITLSPRLHTCAHVHAYTCSSRLTHAYIHTRARAHDLDPGSLRAAGAGVVGVAGWLAGRRREKEFLDRLWESLPRCEAVERIDFFQHPLRGLRQHSATYRVTLSAPPGCEVRANEVENTHAK
eukprot:GHVU01083245.1.p2 GENE.GHVU01083245.1~~GHVU01083245.1.p2  ORF type:complete len:124 (-),score=10.39 GHVU01083245.1:231-602(-)